MSIKAPSDGAKRYPLNMRTTEATRARLELEAKASGRSLAQEVEYCVEQYYGLKDELDMYRKPLIQMMALALKQTESTTGKSWHEDGITAQRVRNVMKGTVDLVIPFSVLDGIFATNVANETEDLLKSVDATLLSLKGSDTAETDKILDGIKSFVTRLQHSLDQRVSGPTPVAKD